VGEEGMEGGGGERERETTPRSESFLSPSEGVMVLLPIYQFSTIGIY
jgi:hypothetical protein